MLVDMLMTTYLVGAMITGAVIFGLGVYVGRRMDRPPEPRRGGRRSKRIARTAARTASRDGKVTK